MEYIYKKGRKIPPKTEILKFSDDFNDDLPIIIQGIKKVIIGNSFNKKISIITDTIDYIEIGDDFNNEIDILPAKLKVLKIGDGFSKTINNLPKQLLVLKIGNSFSRNIDNLPSTLEELYLGNMFNENIDYLPKNLRVLHIGEKFEKRIDNLPKKLEELFIYTRYFDQKLRDLPKSIKNLKIHAGTNLEQIPFLPKLEEIEINYNYNKIIPITSCLKKIKTGSCFNQNIFKNLPDTLETIIFASDSKFNFKIDYPSKLKVLELNDYYDHEINTLPDTVEKLKIGRYHRQLITKFPKNLINLTYKLYDENWNYKDERLINYITIEKSINELSNLSKLCIVPYGKGMNIKQPLERLKIYININNFDILNNLCIDVSILKIVFINVNFYIDKLNDINNLPITLNKIIISEYDAEIINKKFKKIPFDCEIILT